MSSSLPILSAYANSLQQRIREKIATLRAIEEDSPSIIIVHLLKESSAIYMSPRGLDFLGITMEELTAMGAEYHPRFFNMAFAENYVPKILGLLGRNNNDEIISYVQQVRASEKDEWTWYQSCTKIYLRDDEGDPVLIITNAIPLDAGSYIDPVKAERLLEENNFLRNNYHAFDQLTKREQEILRMMAIGDSSSRMAKKLHISPTTASTHRRNIKKKLRIKTNYDVMRFAQAFDLI